MGASWNRSLWSAVGTAVSNETRGLYSQGSGALSSGWEAALFLWAPNVNPFRDPRWGRGQEVVSEDPLVCGEYAAHYIPALQGILPRPDTIEEGGARVKQLPFLKTVATVKHFFDYDLEGSPGTPTSRQEIDVNVTARDQVEFFSPPFEAAITRGHSQSIMCSYNAVNGIPACLSSAMLNDKLRGDWQVRRLSSSLSLSLSSLVSPLSLLTRSHTPLPTPHIRMLVRWLCRLGLRCAFRRSNAQIHRTKFQRQPHASSTARSARRDGSQLRRSVW